MDLILTLLLVIVTYLLIKYYNKPSKFEELGIVHKRPWPIFGNVGKVMFRQSSYIDVIDEIYNMRKDVKYVGFYEFKSPALMIRCPELIKEIAIKKFDHFVDHRGFTTGDQDPIFSNNLFSLCGEKWRETRNLLSPAFTSSKMKSMFHLMNVCAKNYADCTFEKAGKEAGGWEVGSKSFFTKYTTDVIATCAFGISVDSLRNPDNDFYRLGTKAANFEGILAIKFFVFRNFPSITKFFNLKLFDGEVEDFFKSVVSETIETRKRLGISRPDMIQLMMESQEEKKLSLMDMTSQAFVFFFGGFDTTSTLMLFLAHQIAAYPEVQDRLREELRSVLEETGGELTYEAINKMEYLDAVINETLRLFPIAFFMDRVCVKSYELPPAFEGAKPVVLQPGDTVLFPNCSLARDPKYFENPNEFRPERYISDKKNSANNVSAYTPFGLGPRICIGNRFALLETKVVIAHLIAKCDLKPGYGMKLPLRIKKTFPLTVDGGSFLRFFARKEQILCTSQRINGTKVKENS